MVCVCVCVVCEWCVWVWCVKLWCVSGVCRVCGGVYVLVHFRAQLLCVWPRLFVSVSSHVLGAPATCPVDE